MRKQTEPPSSLHAFGIGVAVGFGAGIAVKLLWPRATALAEAVLSKLGFEVGDIFLAIWNPEERLQTRLKPRAKKPFARKKKPRAKATPTPRTSSRATPVSRVKKSSRSRQPKLLTSLPPSRQRLIAPLGIGAN